MTTAGSDTTALALTARLRLRKEGWGAACARPHRGAGGLAEPVWQHLLQKRLYCRSAGEHPGKATRDWAYRCCVISHAAGVRAVLPARPYCMAQST